MKQKPSAGRLQSITRPYIYDTVEFIKIALVFGMRVG